MMNNYFETVWGADETEMAEHREEERGEGLWLKFNLLHSV